MKTNFLLKTGLLFVFVTFISLACNSSRVPIAITAIVIASSATPQPTPTLVCPTGDCASACLTKLRKVLQSDAQPHVADSHLQKDHPVTLVTYSINGNQITSPQFAPNLPSDLAAYQQDLVSQQNVWNYFASIIPADQRTELAYFNILTDGPENLLANVQQFADDPHHWALNVDIMDAANPRSLTYTLIHEFGHLFTLNDSQVVPDTKAATYPDDPQVYQQEAAKCSEYFTGFGCSQPNSYINEFFQKFWPKIYAEWEQYNTANDQHTRYAQLSRFYTRHPTQFVTPYSAVSPMEDIAESWAHFVLSPKPPADSIAEQKVLFFYDHPELVHLRDQIIYGICNYSSGQ